MRIVLFLSFLALSRAMFIPSLDGKIYDDFYDPFDRFFSHEPFFAHFFEDLDGNVGDQEIPVEMGPFLDEFEVNQETTITPPETTTAETTTTTTTTTKSSSYYSNNNTTTSTDTNNSTNYYSTTTSSMNNTTTNAAVKYIPVLTQFSPMMIPNYVPMQKQYVPMKVYRPVPQTNQRIISKYPVVQRPQVQRLPVQRPPLVRPQQYHTPQIRPMSTPNWQTSRVNPLLPRQNYITPRPTTIQRPVQNLQNYPNQRPIMNRVKYQQRPTYFRSI
ncbi:unnamed protein product [Brachionus calyciflorus]|uniref:Uncharacterized protein n=1 Tax=Brachionus calyciflorus TaxID=104777 RepID=A0A813NB97_9BILA|nr:unnamed protein product [Brachionus calyciflorus]